MPEFNPHQSTPPRTVLVWDLPTRLFHWVLAILFAALWISGRTGKLDLHMKAGETVLALLLFRLAWGIMGSQTARFSYFLRGPGRLAAYLSGLRQNEKWTGLGHNPVGGWSVVAVLGCLLLQSVTGLFATDDLASDGPFSWMVSSRTAAILSAVHRLGARALLALVTLHVTAIAFYYFGKKDNLIWPMVVGTKTIPATAKASPPRMANSGLALAIYGVVSAMVYGGIAAWGK